MPDKKSKSKISPASGTKDASGRGQLAKLSKIKIPGNKQVPIVLRAIFSNYDADASGSISKKEMAALVMDLQSLLPGTPAHLKHCSNVVAKIAMAALDLDGGGTIDEDEFVEWCQQNLFLTPEDRAAMLVANMDLSQFITALEMCVKMQLAGIGPYNYYTPPPPTCKEKYCTQRCCCISCVVFCCIFWIAMIPIGIFVILPLLPKKPKSMKKEATSPSGEEEGADDSVINDDERRLSAAGYHASHHNVFATPSAATDIDGDPEQSLPAALLRLRGGKRTDTPRLQLASELPAHMQWQNWGNWQEKQQQQRQQLQNAVERNQAMGGEWEKEEESTPSTAEMEIEVDSGMMWGQQQEEDENRSTIWEQIQNVDREQSIVWAMDTFRLNFPRLSAVVLYVTATP